MTPTHSPDSRAQRIQARAEQDRLDRAAALQLERERLTLDRQRTLMKETARQERLQNRRLARQKRAAAINRLLPTIGRRIMITVPITAPMAVAWVGQINFALGTLGWILPAAIVFAASWELTTAFAGWMYHQARQAGDSGTLFRFATWLFAASAGAMNYWHALNGHPLTHPTPAAVSYGAMSLVGIGLWELYASLIHRQQLRARGLVPSARPRFGVARWARYPRTTWTAWSLSIRDGHTTVEAAWSAARTEMVRKRAKRVSPAAAEAMASNHPGGVDQTTTAAMGLDHSEQMVRTMDATVVRTTGEASEETTQRTSVQTTAAAMDQTMSQTTPETTGKPTRRTTSKGGSKSKRRTREQLKEQIEAEISRIVADGGEIQVKPIADALRANRTTVRQILDEMNIRPIRREATA